MIWIADRSQASIEQEAHQKADAYAERARVTIERHCPVLPALEKHQCIREAAETARKGEHDERDLEAQLVTSVWTHYMGLAAIGGTAFGIIGIFLVLGTFRENKRAADAAHDANRPWIQIEITNKKLHFEETGVRFVGACKFINRGNSPATNVLAYSQMAAIKPFSELTGSVDPALPRAQAVMRDWNKSRALGVSVFPSSEAQHPLVAMVTPQELDAARDNPAGQARFFLTIIVRYVFGDRLGETASSFEVRLTWDTVNYNAIPFSVPPSDIRLQDTYRGYAK